MVEVWHGGSTSIGAQFYRLHVPKPLMLRPKNGLGYKERKVSMHMIVGIGDYPATTACLATKEGVNAYVFDWATTLDTVTHNSL
jgi:hypothetical protein